MTNTPAQRCECKIEHESHYDGLGKGYRNYWIEYCPTHAQAFAMKEALENIKKHYQILVPDNYDRLAAYHIADEALGWAKESGK